jgi:hypothetical protein
MAYGLTRIITACKRSAAAFFLQGKKAREKGLSQERVDLDPDLLPEPGLCRRGT